MPEYRSLADDARALAEQIVAVAAHRSLRVAVAESLTGGLLADALVSVPGASAVFSGGIVAYDTALKESLLGVNAALLRECGPVDPRIACEMAEGIRRACAVPRNDAREAGVGAGARGSTLFPAHIGIATTGVAGPDPDPQTGQPVGTAWIGMSSFAGTRAIAAPVHLRTPPGLRPSRRTIREATVLVALEQLWDQIETNFPET